MRIGPNNIELVPSRAATNPIIYRDWYTWIPQSASIGHIFQLGLYAQLCPHSYTATFIHHHVIY